MANQNDDGGWSTGPGIGTSDWTSGIVVLALRVAKYYQPNLVTEKVLNKALKNAFHYLIISRKDFMIPVLRLLLVLGAQGESGPDFGKGWPWTKNCYSWVEPTAYCLMAFKMPEMVDEQLTNIVVSHANKFLLERACKGGGWNHGAYYCLGEFVPPYILTTAEALIALKDVPQNKTIKEALHYLSNVQFEALSPWSLAWTVLALDAYGYDYQPNLKLLLGLQDKNGSFGGNYMITALSILALNTANGINIFKLKQGQLIR